MSRRPGRDQLQQMLESSLPDEELSAIENHIEACHVCRNILDELTDSPTRSWLALSLVQIQADFTSAEAALQYRIVGHHKRGGLGDVYEAWDERLQRQVAIKILRAEHQHRPDVRRRFVEEAEITAALEHPGIVAVHGRAAPEQERPWYAMRFVHGETLQEAIDAYHAGAADRDTSETRLGLRNLLNHFVAVCNTVAYAHSRGVIHRDLKPNNIMLGAFGETLLLDWGLAKSTGKSWESSVDPETVIERVEKTEISEADARTQAGSAVGTPGYTSPEQAAGRLAEVGPWSDIYSLGATLYALLTGRPPFTGDDREALWRAVQAGTFPRPRLLKREIAPALEAICLRAMAREPQHRYPSAQALAEDVQRWLADESVSAYPEPWTATLRRWLGRHRTLVASASAVILVTTAGLAVATLLLQAANRRERGAKASEQAARTIAEKNFDLARDAVDKYFTKVSENPQLKAQGLEPLRRDLLVQAKDYYERFLREQSDLPSVRADRGSAALRLGQIQQEMGDYPQAEHLYDEGIRTLEAATQEQPGVPDYRNRLACGHELLGVLYVFTSKPKEAVAEFSKMRELEAALAASHPQVAEYQRLTATADMDIGNVAYMGGQMEQAEQNYQQAVARLESLPPNMLEDVVGQTALGKAYTNLANMYGDTSRMQKSEKAYQRALAIWRGIVARAPDDPAQQFNLTAAQHNLAGLYTLTGQNEKAEKAYMEALSLEEEVAARHPAVLDYVVGVGETYTDLGRLFRDRQPQTSLAWYQKAIDTWRKVLAREPRHRTGHIGMQNSRAGSAIALAHEGKVLEATQLVDSVAVETDVAAETWFNLAVGCALCSQAAAGDRTLSSAQGRIPADRHAARAMEFLRRAVEQGFTDADQLKSTRGLDSLRGREDFRKLLGEVMSKAK